MKLSTKLTLSTLATCAISFILFARSCARLPSDAELMTHFEQHSAALEKLRSMLAADTNTSQVADWGVRTPKRSGGSRPDEIGYPQEQYDAYMEAMEQAGVITAIRDEHEFRFGYKGWGFAGKGWRLAYSWRDSYPSNTIANVDHFQRTKPRMEVAYRHIEGNWYVQIIW